MYCLGFRAGSPAVFSNLFGDASTKHLEDKTKPKGRRQQLNELLNRISSTNTSVVIAGDMNTSTHDGTPVSIERALKNRFGSKSFWAKQALGILTGIKLPTLLLTGMNTYRTQADPTVKSIPLIAQNPEAEFFDDLKDFRFDDGNAFDFRGERERSIGAKDDTLANSNERGKKGFITTFEVERTIAFVGKFKLDWIFVKPVSLTNPYDQKQPHRFAPHFGRTLKALNNGPKDRISDHERAGGVEVRCYNPPRFDSPLGWLSRDHRKMLSVDGQVGFITGLCVGRMWEGIPEKKIEPWRDTGIEVRGRAVADIERAFAHVWSMMGEPIPEHDIVSGDRESKH